RAGDIPRLLSAIIEPQHRLSRRSYADRRHKAPDIIVHSRTGGGELADIPIHVFSAHGEIDGSVIPIEDPAPVYRLHHIDESTELALAVLRRVIRRQFDKYPRPLRFDARTPFGKSGTKIGVEYADGSLVIHRSAFDPPRIVYTAHIRKAELTDL